LRARRGQSVGCAAVLAGLGGAEDLWPWRTGRSDAAATGLGGLLRRDVEQGPVGTQRGACGDDVINGASMQRKKGGCRDAETAAGEGDGGSAHSPVRRS